MRSSITRSVLVTVILASLATILTMSLQYHVARAQAGGICGQFVQEGEWPVFRPQGSGQSWLIDPFIYNIFRRGQSARIWGALFGPDAGSMKYLVGYSDIKYVASCEPNISFWADSTTLRAGECTTLRWSVDNVEAIYLDGNGVVGQGASTVCPTVSTTYALRVITYIGETFRTVTINVAAPAPAPTPIPPTPTPRPAPTEITEPFVQVRSTRVNLRSGPGTNYSVIGSAGAGAQLRITGKNSASDWWQVCCVGGQKAWVAAWVVDAFGPLSQVPVVAQPSPIPISARPTPTTPPPRGGNTSSSSLKAGDLAVTISNLRLRSDPGTQSRILATMAEGTHVVVLEGPRYANGFAWWRVRPTGSTGTSGWCAANWLNKIQFSGLDLEPWCEKSSSAQLDSDLTRQACRYFRSEDDFDNFINLVLQSGVSSTQCLINALETFSLAAGTGVIAPQPDMAQNCAEAYIDILDLVQETLKEW